MVGDRLGARWALGIVLAVYGLLAASLVFTALNGGEDFRLLPLSPDFLMGLVAPAVAALILWQHPRNAVGWVLLGAGGASVLFGFANQIGMYTIASWPEATRAATLWAWLAQWTWYPSFAVSLTFLPLLFPDGHIPSPRWRPVLWVAAFVVTVRTFVLATWPGQLLEGAVPIENPVGTFLAPLIEARLQVLWDAWPLLVSVCASAVLVRYRRADAEQRAQLRWWLTALVIGTGFYLVTQQGVALALLVPAATAVAILRYRLYDIDRVLVRAIVFGALAGIMILAYALAVGLTAALAGRTAAPSFILSVAVTIAAAVALLPVRERLERLARRLVYGERAEPYEVLRMLAAQISQTPSVEEILPELAGRVGRALGASTVSVRVFLPGGRAREALWPDDAPTTGLLVATRSITNAGQPVGELGVFRRDATPLNELEDRLLQDLVAHSGPALHNVALHVQLETQLEALLDQAAELRASRERIFTAETAARRNLERDIHDGAQQQLIALAVQLGRAAESLHAEDPETSERLRSFQLAAERTLDNLRNLSRGLHPPVLTDLGIGAALRTYVSATDAPVRLRADVGRLPPHLEAAVYFCVLEAVQNATKHADATTITVNIREENGAVSFVVEDDGCGFHPQVAITGAGLQNLRDRIDAVGGEIALTSSPGQGTRVEGRIPVPLGRRSLPGSAVPVATG